MYCGWARKMMKQKKANRAWVFHHHQLKEVGEFFLVLSILITSYVIYFVRYPIWSWTAEPIFAVLISSYLVVLLIALALLKKDMNKSLSDVFSFHGSRLVLIGLGLAILLEALWYSLALAMWAEFEFLSFPFLRGYELYTYYSLPLAFALYAYFPLLERLQKRLPIGDISKQEFQRSMALL